jgi:hypothetical protein
MRGAENTPLVPNGQKNKNKNLKQSQLKKPYKYETVLEIPCGAMAAVQSLFIHRHIID